MASKPSLFTYAWRNLVGCQVEVTLKGGSKLQGIFQSLDNPTKGIHLECIDYDLRRSHVTVISLSDLVQLYAKEVKDNINAPGATPATRGLATDSDIAQSHSHLSGRQLQKAHPTWVSAHPADGGLEDMPHSGEKWDQFAANEQFGVRSTYREEYYTSKLDKSKLTREQIEHADRIARSIEGNTAGVTNVHLLEERGVNIDDAGMTEEDKYSGVLRSAPGSYVPPHRRQGGAPDSGATAPQPAPTKSYASALGAASKSGAGRLPHRERIREGVAVDEESRKAVQSDFQTFSSNLDKQTRARSGSKQGEASTTAGSTEPEAAPKSVAASESVPVAAEAAAGAEEAAPKGKSLAEYFKNKNLSVDKIPEFTPGSFAPAIAPPVASPITQQVAYPAQYAYPAMAFPGYHGMARSPATGAHGGMQLYSTPAEAMGMVQVPMGNVFVLPNGSTQMMLPGGMQGFAGQPVYGYPYPSTTGVGSPPVAQRPMALHTGYPAESATITTISMSPHGTTVSQTQTTAGGITLTSPASIPRTEPVEAAKPKPATLPAPAEVPVAKTGPLKWSEVSARNLPSTTAAPAAAAPREAAKEPRPAGRGAPASDRSAAPSRGRGGKK